MGVTCLAYRCILRHGATGRRRPHSRGSTSRATRGGIPGVCCSARAVAQGWTARATPPSRLGPWQRHGVSLSVFRRAASSHRCAAEETSPESRLNRLVSLVLWVPQYRPRPSLLAPAGGEGTP